MEKILTYIFGFSKYRIICADTADFLSQCVKKNIKIWDVKKINEITMEFSSHSYDDTQLKEIFSELSLRVESDDKFGLIYTILRYKGRKFFIGGLILFLILIVLSGSFIRTINVEGNELLSDEEVIELLDKAGFKKGSIRYGVDVKAIKNRFMLLTDKVAWIWIDIEGTVANVSVKDRNLKGEILDASDYCNCVASSDGVITEIMPRTGRQIVHIGDVVKKGDVLISGISETKAGGIRYMHADGIVTARTWYQRDGVYNNIRVDRFRTGKSKNIYSLNVGNYEYKILRENISPYEKYDYETEKREILKIFKKFLPLSFTINRYYEIIEENVTISEKEVVDTAVNVLGEQIKDDLKDKKDLTIINKTHEYRKTEDGNIYVKVVFECSENISEYKKIEKPEYGEDIENNEKNEIED